MGHVTPVLFHKEPDGQWLCVIMDSVGKNQIYSIPKQITIIYSDQVRQLDHVSCPTDAIITLRNALLDIKDKESRDPKQSYSIQAMLNSNPHPILNYLLPFLFSSTTLTQTGDNCFVTHELPLSWIYTSQRLDKKHSSSTDRVIRDLYSSNPDKRSNPKTVGEFRRLHDTAVSVETLLSSGISEVTEVIDSPKNKVWNTYLPYKAAKLVIGTESPQDGEAPSEKKDEPPLTNS